MLKLSFIDSEKEKSPQNVTNRVTEKNVSSEITYCMEIIYSNDTMVLYVFLYQPKSNI